MAWLGKVSLGGFPDLAGAVNKLSESVKNIEKNFDSALGFEEKSETNEASGIWPSAVDRKALFDPVMAFMGNRGDESRNRGDGSNPESPEKVESVERPSSEEKQDDLPSEVSIVYTAETELGSEKASMIFGTMRRSDAESISSSSSSSLIPGPDKDKIECQSNVLHNEEGSTDLKIEGLSSSEQKQSHENVLNSTDGSQEGEKVSKISPDIGQDNIIIFPALDSSHDVDNSQNIHDKLVIEENIDRIGSPKHLDGLDNGQLMPERESPGSSSLHISKATDLRDFPDVSFSSLHSSPQYPAIQDFSTSNELIERGSPMKSSDDINEKVDRNMMTGLSDFTNILTELEKVKKEREMMQSALQGAARQAQAKADEIAKLMNENEQLKSAVEELKRNTTEADIDALRDEFHQRVANLERKVYALTKERDTLRREQNKRSDAAALLKEKDEIITQIMAEGEGLSKKQAAQESTIRKLRAQIREMEEEKQRISTKLQVEETKSESIRKDKLATEKLLQETIEKYQADISSQKEFYNSELKLAKEAEALAELRANSEAQIELECRLKESGERESMLVQTLEELRQALTRTEQQAATKEEMLRQDIDEIQKRYQASELRYSEMITQVPDSKRPLLRQIEAMQETASRREEAWRDVERSLNFRVQEAEAKAAAADERERSISEQLSQSLSRITVLETQITFLRTEQGQFSRTLEKERQRSAENRQEYLIAKEEALTQEGRANQFEEEIKELTSKHKKELEEVIAHRELVEKELERERTARIELEKTASRQTSVVVDQNYSPDLKTTYADNGIHLPRRLSSARSMNNMDESAFLQASLDSSGCPFSERKAFGETLSPYALKSMTPSAFEAALRQKDGELASYISRLASMEMARDSLTEELFKLTRESEKLRGEASLLPGIKAELDALRRRHNAALELMGERDEELEELRADIIDLKEMYREQIDLLVNRIQKMTPQAGAQ